MRNIIFINRRIDALQIMTDYIKTELDNICDSLNAIPLKFKNTDNPVFLNLYLWQGKLTEFNRIKLIELIALLDERDRMIYSN